MNEKSNFNFKTKVIDFVYLLFMFHSGQLNSPFLPKHQMELPYLTDASQHLVVPPKFTARDPKTRSLSQ